MDRRTKLATTSLWVMAAVSLVIISFPGANPFAAAAQTDLPQQLARLNDLLKLTPEEVQTLKAGRPVSKLLDTNADREVAVAGVVWIDAPIRQYVQAIKNIERLEHGSGFQVTKRISNPPRLEDFAALTLPEDDVKDLKTCEVGNCEVKLDKSAIDRIHKEIDWSKPTATADVNALVRQLALEYVNAYQQGGNTELAVYRDKDQPTYTAQEFAAMVGEMPELRKEEPALRQYLLEYPKAQLPNATSFFYWQKVKFGLKPTIRINHVVITEAPGRVLVAFKQLYASHYFWTALELREAIPDPSRGSGFWFVDVSRGRSGSLTGFKGHAVRGRVRDEALKGLNEGMQATKSSLERKTQ
jgi:hypothetical protein